MSKGFLWIAQNNSSTDYVSASVRLCESIKKYCTINQVCLVTDASSKVPAGIFDKVVVIEDDSSKQSECKMHNEWKVFHLSPFTHTIKLEADMLVTSNLDWWWNLLCQHDMVFSYNCRDYQDNIVKESPYRKLFRDNMLPDVYNGLHYFRRSRYSQNFYSLCKDIMQNWQYVQEQILINCHDKNPTTDVVYALANKLLDPLQTNKIDYEWFKFIHYKQGIQPMPGNRTLLNYVSPYSINGDICLGSYKINRIWHYHQKNIPEKLHARTF